MPKRPFFLTFFYFLFFYLTFPFAAYSENGEWVPGVIHLHTKIGEGDGVLTPLEMAEKVREKGIGIAIINDHDNERVEYGIFPLRRIVKKVVERNSIGKYGEEDYLKAVKAADDAFPELILLPGIEAVPTYYWKGSPFNDDLTLMNWHKHILVMGLETPEDVRGMPSVGRGWAARLDIWCLLQLWPVVVIPLGIFLIRYKRYTMINFSNLRFKELKRPYRVIGYSVLTAGIVFLINNFPYCMPAYDQYHGDQGIGPYQEVIDYVNERGGLTFWAHPDALFNTSVNGVRVTTHPHPEDLIKSIDYTGFAALVEGKNVSKPGGIWDRLLKEYLEGVRKRPIWAIGELDYKEGDWMGETQTVFFLKERTKEETLNALKEGRVYAVTGLPHKPFLKRFEAWDEKEKIWKTMGSTVTVSDKVRIRVEIEYPDGRGLVMRLIRGGEVIDRRPFKKHLLVEIEEAVDKDIYYRVDIDSILISNPIFVKRLES